MKSRIFALRGLAVLSLVLFMTGCSNPASTPQAALPPIDQKMIEKINPSPQQHVKVVLPKGTRIVMLATEQSGVAEKKVYPSNAFVEDWIEGAQGKVVTLPLDKPDPARYTNTRIWVAYHLQKLEGGIWKDYDVYPR